MRLQELSPVGGLRGSSSNAVQQTTHIVLWTGAVTVAALLLGHAVPILGPAVVAILLGLALRSAWPATIGAHSTAALGHRALQVAIVLLGASLDLGTIAHAAGASLIVMLGTLAAGMFGIWQIGRIFGIPPRLRSLLAGGTSICGASAIVAIAPAVGAATADITYAVGVIFLFNIIAVVVFPVLGHLFGFSATTFGTWAGTAINDTSSVLAAGYAFGDGAASYAATVKLARTVMILPVTLSLALLAQRWLTAPAVDDAPRRGTAAQLLATGRKAVPWFVIAFVIGSLCYTLGLWDHGVAHRAGQGAQYLTVIALAAVGLSMDGRALLRAGHAPVLTGLCGWVLVAVTSLLLQGLVHLAG